MQQISTLLLTEEDLNSNGIVNMIMLMKKVYIV